MMKPHEHPGIKPVVGNIQTAEEAAAGKKTVRMNFTKPVNLSTDYSTSIFFPAGVNEVPEHLAHHWFLKVNGATVVAED